MLYNFSRKCPIWQKWAKGVKWAKSWKKWHKMTYFWKKSEKIRKKSEKIGKNRKKSGKFRENSKNNFNFFRVFQNLNEPQPSFWKNSEKIRKKSEKIRKNSVKNPKNLTEPDFPKKYWFFYKNFFIRIFKVFYFFKKIGSNNLSGNIFTRSAIILGIFYRNPHLRQKSEFFYKNFFIKSLKMRYLDFWSNLND